jgi:DNA polymerase-3 subunit epsilon
VFRNLFSKQQPPPVWLEDYFAAKANLPTRETPLRDLRFVVLDTETTGIDTKKDNLLSIGSLAIDDFGLNIGDSIESVLYQKEHKANEAILIHGLRPTDIADGIQVQTALVDFIQHLSNSVIVAHHTGFDVAMLSKAIRQFYPDFKMYNYQLDTAKLALKIDGIDPQKILIDRRQYTLDALCDRYEVEMFERHTAWGDAYTTGILFLKLINILEKRGQTKLGDFVSGRFRFFGI